MSSRLSKEEAVLKIQNKLNEINQQCSRDIEFLGFVDDTWRGNTTKLVLKCRIHNITWNTTSYNNCLKKTFSGGCRLCKIESIVNTHRLSPEEALERVENLHKTSKYSYDFSPILKTYKGFHEKVEVICPMHGPFEVVYCNLLLGEDSAMCPECRKEALSNRVKTDIFGEDIKSKINNKLKNIEETFGVKYEMLGYRERVGDSRPMRSYLILKCSVHNTICDTTTIDNFLNKTILPCPECNSKSIGELTIRRVLNSYFPIDEILYQYRLSVNKLSLCKIKTLIPDFYIKSIQAFIEFDGEQHYRFIPYFHRQYQNFVDQVNRDNYLIKYCREHYIKLLRIPYCDINRIEDILKAFLTEGRDISTHIEPKLLPVPMSYYGQNFTSRP